jgi:Flp pilus assembly protein TadG
VEFALVAPILLMFVLGIIDFGRLYFTQVSLTQAAREGARLEALGSSNVVTGATGSATGLSGLTVYINGGPTGYTSNPSPAIACTPGADATVKVESTNFTFTLAGLLGIGPKTIVGYGVMPCGG